MYGKYTCTFSSNAITKVSFNKFQQTNFTRVGCENLSAAKEIITWCHVPQTLKAPSSLKDNTRNFQKLN